MKEYLSPEEVAELLGVHLNTVYNWLHNGKLPALQIGKTWRIRIEDLNKRKGIKG